jgi:alpha-tubulin suppressor-like RCC1 family protein
MKSVVSILTATLLLTSILAGRASTVVAWGSGPGINCPPDLTNATKIAAGNGFGLALKSDGTVVAWGPNGDPNFRIPEAATNVVDIAAGTSHSLALRADGQITAWGGNAKSQLAVPPDLTNIIAISAGGYHSLVLRADHTVTNFGQYYDYNQGLWVAAPIPANFTNIIAIASGYYHDLLLRADHTVVGWGSDSFGQSEAPDGLTNVVAIAASTDGSLALQANGRLVYWGNSSFDRLNLPNTTNITTVAAGLYHMLALKRDRTVCAWGKNDSFQCDVPQGLSNVVAIAAGGDYSLALVAEPVTEPVSLTISNALWDNGVFSVSLPTTQGKTYRLEYKSSLDDGNWTALDPVSGNGDMMQLQDTMATEPQRLYRVRME